VTTLVIAEAGVNHNGDLGLARELVAAAADAGADAVKFQTFDADRLVTPSAAKAAYQSAATGDAESQHAMLRRLALSRDAHERLMEECRGRNIAFASTPFDVPSVDLLVALGVPWLKVPSGEISDLPFLRHVGGAGLPVLLSTGMSTLDEVGAALAALADAGTPRDRVRVLQCNTAYPTPIEDTNLRAMLTIRDAFGVAVGYSDHTDGTDVAVAAVALGASVIEKHLTLDRGLPGPDQAASLEPDAFRGMVASIRRVERALGDGVKRPTASERPNLLPARKSLVAARPIRAGELFDCENLTAKRPGGGVSPMRWDAVIGTRATRDYLADEPIEP
jgi:N,N'-diacetyllegionaminate synthase